MTSVIESVNYNTTFSSSSLEAKLCILLIASFVAYIHNAKQYTLVFFIFEFCFIFMLTCINHLPL